MSTRSKTVTDAIAAYNAGDIEGYFAHHSAATELVNAPMAVADLHSYRAQVLETRTRWPSLTVGIERLHEDGTVVVMESSVDFGDGRPPHPEAVVFDLDASGRIKRTRVYSSAPIGSQLGGGDA